jgi:phosphate transport system permease protein
MREWVKSGAPWIWLTAGAVAVALVLVFGVLWLTAARGLVHFWPKPVVETTFIERDGRETRLIGELREREEVPVRRLQESGFQHRKRRALRDALSVQSRQPRRLWHRLPLVSRAAGSANLPTRRTWSPSSGASGATFYGHLKAVKESGVVVAEGAAAWPELQKRVDRANRLFRQIFSIEKYDIGRINFHLERLRLQERKLELRDQLTPALISDFEQRREEHILAFRALQDQIEALRRDIHRDSLTAEVQTGQLVDIPLAKVADAYRANAMSFFHKVGFYFHKLWEFVSEDPREANTEGGIFPAIFGTVLMVILMSIIVTPARRGGGGLPARIREAGTVVTRIRIAVNNLAGVPSIVYGVFGLGFFVYVLGRRHRPLFFPEALPAPTFGTPGLLWASLTLAMLTLPVVIVATEEGLSRVSALAARGSLALGATKAETLWRTVLPMASPAMMTGLILAVARAAGEVAPLMLVGVVKLAPTLPMDGNFPVRAPRAQVHASRLPHLRRRLPEPERRSGAAAGVCDRASAGAGDRGAQPDRHPMRNRLRERYRDWKA